MKNVLAEAGQGFAYGYAMVSIITQIVENPVFAIVGVPMIAVIAYATYRFLTD